MSAWPAFSSDSIRRSNSPTRPSRELVEVAAGAGEDRHHLLLHRHRLVLRLLQQLRQPRAAREQRLGGGVEVGGELREGRHLAVLRELQLDAPGDLLHRLDLRRRAHARDRDADVHRRADALVEQLRLQEDLAVGDGDDVGRDVGRDVARLRLDHRQRGQRAGAEVVVHLRRPLQQARVQVEHVARIGLAARRAAQQQRHLPVGDRLLGEVVVEDDRVHAVVAEELAHGAAGVGREELHRRRVGRRGGDDDGVLHRAVLLRAS